MSIRDSVKKFAKNFGPKAVVSISEAIIHWVETIAALILVFLFLLGVFDLALQVYELFTTGVFTNPLAVIDLIDTVLLLLIIVEVYETVIAYANEENQRQILLTVIYAGVIALVRKAIIFRVGEYSSPTNALLAASAYSVVLIGLALALYITYKYGDSDIELSDTPRDSTLTGSHGENGDDED